MQEGPGSNPSGGQSNIVMEFVNIYHVLVDFLLKLCVCLLFQFVLIN